MAAPAATPKPQTRRPQGGAQPQPVVMKVQPKPEPTGPPREPTPPADDDRPWWSRMWLVLTLVGIVAFPGITIWAIGGFSPTIEPVKPIGSAVPGTIDVVIHWILQGAIVFAAGFGLKKGWNLLPPVVALAFAWTWFSNIVRRPDVGVELLWPATLMVVIGLVLGSLGQFVYGKLNA